MSNLAPHTTLVFHNPELKIHVFHSPSDSAGEAVNSLILETSASLVLFDLPVLYPVAEQIASFSKNLNKPIRKIVISHGHPDHWFGLWCFREQSSFASSGTISEISQFGEAYLAFKRTEMKPEELPPGVAVPKTALDSSDEVIDGVTFSWKRHLRVEYEDGLSLVLPQHRVLVAADLIYNKVHLYLGQKDEKGLTGRNWLSVLKSLSCESYDTIIPGHGQIGDERLIAECIDYIEKIMPLLEREDADVKLYMAETKRLYPNYRMEELIGLTAYFAFGKS